MLKPWLPMRNRLLASPAFQAWAARFPLTRPIARRRAAALFDLTAGFVYAQLLAACVELGLLEMLSQTPLSADVLAERAGLPLSGASALLTGAEALGLAESLGGGRYTLGGEGAALLGNPGALAMIAHHHRLYADLRDPVALLRRGGGGGDLEDFWPYARDGDGGAEAYSALMAASQPMIAEQLLGAYDFGCHRRLLDIGGGEGAFLEAVAAKHPRLALDLFDLPGVASRAASRLGGRVKVHPGSFRTDPLPEGADVVTLVRILHDHDDAVALALLRSVAQALPPGGALVIAEPMAGTRGAKRVGAYFSLYLLAMGSGRPRTANEIHAMLRAAGFASSRERRTALPMLARVIVARR